MVNLSLTDQSTRQRFHNLQFAKRNLSLKAGKTKKRR